MQVSPRRLLPQEAVPERGKVRGTGERQRRQEDGAVISVISGGGFNPFWWQQCRCKSEFRTAVGCAGDGVWQTQPQLLSLQTVTL